MAERTVSPGNLAAEHEARDWVVRVSSGAISEKETEELRCWLAASAGNREAFERERSFWRGLQDLERDFASAQSSAGWIGTAGRRRSVTAVLGTALAVCLVVAAWFLTDLPLQLTADHMTGLGKQAVLRLPDGSTAYLNSDSAIDVRYGASLRLVVLRRGEAMFDVKPDKHSTFRVAALGGNTDATGTVFATRIVSGEVIVTVAEGSVRVFGPAAPDATPMPAEGINVGADQQTSYVQDNRPASLRPVNAADALAWRGGSIVFDGRPFAQAITEIGRYIPERVVLDGRAQQARPVSGVFSVGQPYRAIEAIAATQGFAIYRIPHVAIFIR